MIGIIDYGAGNLASVYNAIDKLGYNSAICYKPTDIHELSRIILPGVGSFRQAMAVLSKHHWLDSIEKYASSGKPVLGICLGMQLLFDTSDEQGKTQGLGLIPGRVVKLKPDNELKVPHVGWNNLVDIGSHPLLSGIKSNVDFYFVHSYQCVPDDRNNSIARCNYGGEFVAVVGRENIVGVQFHPEKSQQCGLRLLKNFMEWCP